MKTRTIVIAALASLFLAPAVLAQEVFQPIDLAKNPYRFKGHSGVLDTRSTLILMPDGATGRYRVPMSSMSFDKMLDEQVAVYEVGAYDNGVLMPQGELVVILSDSTPPELSRLWKVQIQGPVKGWNEFGATLTTTAVRFEGYYVPPPPTPEQLAEQAARTSRTSSRMVSVPQVIFSIDPEFTDEARKAKLQGICTVQTTVDAEGKPQNIHVVGPLDPGLDQKAIEAVRQYRFKPAMSGGKPIPAIVNIEVNFRIY